MKANKGVTVLVSEWCSSEELAAYALLQCSETVVVDTIASWLDALFND